MGEGAFFLLFRFDYMTKHVFFIHITHDTCMLKMKHHTRSHWKAICTYIIYAIEYDDPLVTLDTPKCSLIVHILINSNDISEYLSFYDFRNLNLWMTTPHRFFELKNKQIFVKVFWFWLRKTIISGRVEGTLVFHDLLFNLTYTSMIKFSPRNVNLFVCEC